MAWDFPTIAADEDTPVKTGIINRRMKGLSQHLKNVPFFPVRDGEKGVIETRYDYGTGERYGARTNAPALINRTAFQNAVDSMAALGGGVVQVGRGTYNIDRYIAVPSGITIRGHGYASRLNNTATSGFGRCCIVTGNIGDATNENSLWDLPSDGLDAIAIGDRVVTFQTAADADDYEAGDQVFIASYETWPEAFPEDRPKWNNLNIVEENLGSGQLRLRWAIPDVYSTASGNPTIARITGNTLNGYDGAPLWMAENAVVENLRLTQTTGLASGWYALFAFGFSNRYENLWMDDCSTIIGANALAYSVVQNIDGSYEGAGYDLADVIHNCRFRNLKGTRFATNAHLSGIGFSFHLGSDLDVDGLQLNLGGTGAVQFYHVARVRCAKPVVVNSNGGTLSGAIGTGPGTDIEIRDPVIRGSDKHGISISSERTSVLGGYVVDVDRLGASNRSVHVASSVVEWSVTGVTCGDAGSRVAADDIAQATALSAYAVLRDNVTYSSGPAQSGTTLDSDFADTNSASLTTLKRYTVAATTVRPARMLRVHAAGLRSGTAGAKQVQLLIDGNVIAQVDYLAADTAAWQIEAVISHADNSTNVRVYGRGLLGTTIQYSSLQPFTALLASDVDIELKASAANSGDTIAVYQFHVVEETD